LAELIDISVPIHPGMHVWPGDPPVRVDRVASLAEGDSCNLSRLDLCAHTGTHIDAPLHFVRGGASVDQLPLDAFVGPARVVDARDRAAIGAEDIEAIAVQSGERILFRTANSERWTLPSFLTDFVALTDEAAELLASRGPRLVGIDYLSAQPFHADTAGVHDALLGAGIAVLEGLNLAGVEPGQYELICTPLLILGCEGAPARALLRR